MYIQRANAFYVVVLLVVIIVFLYSLGLVHTFACGSRNPVIFSVLGFIENFMSVSYILGTKALSPYMPLTNCSF